jgi:hypothetical protein
MKIEINSINIEGTIYKRKLNVEATNFKLNETRIEIPADIIYYTANDVELGRAIFNSKKVNNRTGQLNFEAGRTTVFVVDDNTTVNPLTGEYVNPSTPGAIGEYTYFMYLLNNMNLLVANGITSLEGQLLPSSINRAIAAGRLDYE